MAYRPLVAAATGAVAGMFGGGAQQGPPNWQSELFDCSKDNNVCLQTWCCPWCTESNLMNKRERNIADMDPGYCCGACCLDIITRGFFSSAFSFGLRRELIARYGIMEEPYVNTCVQNICTPCSLCQSQREMIMRNEHPGGMFAKAPADGNAIAMGQQVVGAVKNFGAATLNPVTFGSEPFDCDMMECFDSWCCAPCTLAHMANRVDMGRSALIPAGSENKMDPATCCAACCCAPQFSYALRREVVNRYGINTENHIMSFLWVVFCAPCTIAQTRREMSYRGEWPGGILVKEPIVKRV